MRRITNLFFQKIFWKISRYPLRKDIQISRRSTEFLGDLHILYVDIYEKIYRFSTTGLLGENLLILHKNICRYFIRRYKDLLHEDLQTLLEKKIFQEIYRFSKGRFTDLLLPSVLISTALRQDLQIACEKIYKSHSGKTTDLLADVHHTFLSIFYEKIEKSSIWKFWISYEGIFRSSVVSYIAQL